MNESRCHCVLPGPTEEEMVVLPGDKPGTAIKVWLQPGPDGFVRLEQLAYNDGLGWYTQKSMCIPAEMLQSLATQFRKADCLIPRAQRTSGAEVRMRIGPAIDPRPAGAERKNA
jgi:hypothetical protein